MSRKSAKLADNRPIAAKARAAGSKSLDMDILPDLLGFNIRRAQIELWRDFIHNVGGSEIRPGLFSLLLLISANRGIAQVDLANQLGIDKTTIVGLIARLETLGWVTRERSCEDRRRQGVFITAEGEKALAQLKRQLRDHERRFVKLFTPEEYRQLMKLLQRIFAAP